MYFQDDYRFQTQQSTETIAKQIKKGKKKFKRRNSKTDDTPRRGSTVNDTFLNVTVNVVDKVVLKAKTALHKKKHEDSDKDSEG